MSTHEHSSIPAPYVTAAGRDEIARPTRGLSVWQRRLLQGLIAHGTLRQAMAADAVLRRRPLEADLDRLFGLGLIQIEAESRDDNKVISAGHAARHNSAARRRAGVLIIASIVVGSAAAAIGYLSSGKSSGARHDAPTQATAPSAAPAEETLAPAAAPPDLPIPATIPRSTPTPPREKLPPSRPDSAPGDKAAELASVAAPAVTSAPPSPISEKRDVAAVAATPAPAAPLPAPTLATAADIRPAEVPPLQLPTKPVIDPNSACGKLDYPPAALRAAQTGIVALSFLIDVDGHVIETRIDRSSGYRVLDDAARRGLSRCKFIPAMSGSKPEQAWGKLEYEWRLD